MNNEEKVEKLELALAEAQMIAEDSDKKYDEVQRKLAMTESDLERSTQKADDFEKQCKDLEEELKIVGKNMRELEVSENRALENEEVYEATIREISNKLKASEKRSVEFELLSGKLSKDVDKLEKELEHEKEDMVNVQGTMEQTLELFANMA